MMAYEDTDDYKNLKKARAREDADAAEPGTETMAAFMKRTGTKARPPMARTYTKKGPIVTKEQMKKAGFDNLRDYLNAERGLTRRKSDTDIITEGAKKMYNESFGRMRDMTPDQIARAKEITEMPDEERSRQGQYGTMKKGGAVKKMKSGGTVSSASKRADGCAVRGKTKGRMI
jgi:hypothetical protein